MEKSGFEGDFEPQEPTNREKVERFLKLLIFEFPKSPESKPRGENLFEVEGLEQKSLHPPLVSEGHLEILPGQAKALTGPNGSGKTSFFKTFLGKLPDEIKHKPGLKIGYLPQQNDFDSIENMTLGEAIDEVAESLAEANNWDFDYQLLETCKNVLFQDVLNNKVVNLSGGEKTKLQMLVLLLGKTEVVFLDEPTNHIDHQGQALLAALIKNLRNTGTSFVISSHNQEFLNEVCQDGAFNISISSSSRKISQSKKLEVGESKTTAETQMPWDLEKSVCDSQPFAGDYVSINGQRVYFSPIEKNNKIVLAGPNGSGKSTFFRELLEQRMLQPGVRPAFLPQEWPKEITEGSLDEMVKWCIEKNRGFDFKIAAQNFYRNLGQSSFNEKRPKGFDWKSLKFSDLSVGEQRYLWFLAVASSPGFNFLVLDEPTNHMDAQLKAEITRVIEDFPGAVVVATHDSGLMEAVNRSTDLTTGRFWLLEKGVSDVNDYGGGADKYFEELPRKAVQAVKQLNI